jgi:alkaline phosphatase
MRKESFYLFVAVLSFVLVSWVPSDKANAKCKPKIKNVIFLIGDGMGIATLYAGMTVSENPLNIEKCTVTGLQKTFSADNYITDSAAAGTALACGTKTNNGVIGQDPQGNKLKSILDIADEKGLATGIVVVTDITDATPASFVAHSASRGNADDIALDFLKTDLDVFIGGGYNHFGKRKDGINLIDSLKMKGYEVDTTMAAVAQSKASKLVALTDPLACPYRLNGRGPMLAVGSKKALDILSKNKRGFFLMIEGSHIDHGGHDNNQDVLVEETLDLDEAIGLALDFANADGHTLVVITSDHETGGVTLVDGNMKSHKVKVAFSSKGHTVVMVPVFAYGPGAEKFTGVYDNTAFFGKFLDSYKFGQKGKK